MTGKSPGCGTLTSYAKLILQRVCRIVGHQSAIG
nr:MAG TPA: hypothetical protein [Caudoviricetes sp.]DAI21360.1 MAG TPA: hypothetical protein [Caudoviricetes sp.]DAM25733.1 MAG TPA: hypothetical protein [Caudoviricetes sp.]DAP39236.1 MAG TPA: hypothetical protein [Caudoviricetes sp.]DAQ47820.1 MAG TPA: hypothetical protein [Caudoviricetes sp.]